MNEYADIAAELVRRNIQIDRLTAELSADDRNAQIACDTIAELSKDKERLIDELEQARAELAEARALADTMRQLGYFAG